MNIVLLSGRLGKDPELRYTNNGTAVATFSLATTTKTAENEYTEWHNIVVWKKQGEACANYLHKGSKCFIEGRMQTRSFEDRDTGKKRYITEVVAHHVEFLDGKPQQSGGESSGGTASASAEAPPAGSKAAGSMEDDLPF